LCQGHQGLKGMVSSGSTCNSSMSVYGCIGAMDARQVKAL
jgi:hypothetical protein